MASADPKRTRASGRSTRDQLSALPDELLHRVLSFLPAQQVVQTTVLSKRWKDLWLYATSINLNLMDFQRVFREEGWNRMEDFANNLLRLHRAPFLDAFRLTIFGGYDLRPGHFDTWVRRAIKDNPLVFEVSVNEFYSCQLPYLGCSPCRLTKLHLNGVSLDHSFAEHLQSLCPELKDLSLTRCGTAFCVIQSDTLENLDLLDIGITNPTADVFAIRAPRLASLSVHLEIPFSLDAGNSILRASVSFESSFSPRSKALLLGSLFSVTDFELRYYLTMAWLDEVFDKIPIFHNLRTLSVCSCFLGPPEDSVHELKALGKFLQKSPNLEKLTLKSVEVGSFVEVGDFPVLENMRTLILDCCVLDANFQMLLHFLWNSPNLEKLIIQHLKLSDDDMGEEGRTKSKKSKKIYSQYRDMVPLRCLKLKCIEIVRSQENAGVPEFVRVLLDLAGPNITLTYTNM